MADELRRIPIHRALHRPDLIAGCERELILITGLITLALIAVAQTWFAFFIGILFWFFIVFALRKMAKHDPFLSKVFLRHVRYERYYPARSTPFAEGATHKRGW